MVEKHIVIHRTLYWQPFKDRNVEKETKKGSVIYFCHSRYLFFLFWNNHYVPTRYIPIFLFIARKNRKSIKIFNFTPRLQYSLLIVPTSKSTKAILDNEFYSDLNGIAQ